MADMGQSSSKLIKKWQKWGSILAEMGTSIIFIIPFI